MGYIMNLRKIVGHIPLLQCGAGVIIEDKEGRILLQLRVDNGCWGMPGGSIELDEPLNNISEPQRKSIKTYVAYRNSLSLITENKALQDV